MLKTIAWILLFVCSGTTSNQCFINESQITWIESIQHPEPIQHPTFTNNFTNITFHNTPSNNEFKKCTLCTRLQLPEYTFSYGTDNPDTALLNQYRP